jgi:hypothetical protein
MEENYDVLITVLEARIKKNGERPLTDLQLLNILKKVRKQIEKGQEFDDMCFDPNYDL